MITHYLNWMVLDFALIIFVLGFIALLHHRLTYGSFYLTSRNHYVCMGIAFANICTITLWIIISTSAYTPALFDSRLNGGEQIAIPEPSFQGGQPFNILSLMFPNKNILDVVSETFDVRNYSEVPRYPKGDFIGPC